MPPRDGEPLLVSLGFRAPELTQGLEQAKAIGAGSRRDDHRAVDERRQQVGDERRGQTVARAHLLGRVEPERGRKDGEPAEQGLLRLRKQPVAPADHAGERALAFGEHLRSPAQQRESIGETVGDLPRRERPQPRGRKLEREREAVEALTQLRDRTECLVVQLEVAPHSSGPLDEEAHRVGVGKRRDLEDRLSRNAERLEARRKQPYPWTRSEERDREHADGRRDVLAVVEEEQKLAPLQVALKKAECCRGLSVEVGAPQADGYGNSLRDPGGVTDRRQVDEPGAVGLLSTAARAVSTARLVLPTPPGPVSVTRRCSPKRSRTSA